MKTLYTVIDPIPASIPRQLAIELLQSHGELITLNPNVISYEAVKAPRDAPADEYYSTWYEILVKIKFIPGIGKMGQGNVTFRGCFHDMPWGVQTHMYVPMGIDLRHKYQVRGNQPGEPPEPKELGSNAPAEGLYLRTDTQIKCNVTALSFVKKEQKVASKTMIDRMIRKAELIDAGVLQAMFDGSGRLQTANPNDRTRPQEPMSAVPATPSLYGPNGMNLRSPTGSSHGSNRQSAYARQSYYAGQQPPPPPPQQQQQQLPQHQYPDHNIVEAPGDMSYALPNQGLQPRGDNRMSYYSELGGSSPQPQSGRWSGVQSDGQSSHGGSIHSYPTTSVTSPRMDQYQQPSKSFAAELPGDDAALPPRPPKEELNQDQENVRSSQQSYSYNPADYAQHR